MNTSASNLLPTFDSPVLQTDFDMSTFKQGQPLRGSSNRQFVRFYYQTVSEVYTVKAKINEKTGASTPIETAVRQVTRERVQIITPGDTNEYDGEVTHWERTQFYKQYKAFRDGRTAPIGMPIEECQFVSPHVALELKYLGCHTVEQLADGSDVLCGAIGDGYELREFARAYCKAQIANKTSPQVIALSSELDKAKAQIAEMQSRMSTLVAPDGTPLVANKPVKRERVSKPKLDLAVRVEQE